jgi:hypothetical protein
MSQIARIEGKIGIICARKNAQLERTLGQRVGACRLSAQTKRAAVETAVSLLADEAYHA